MKKKLQDLLDNYQCLLTLMEKRRDEDMARLYKIEVQLMNIVEIDLKKKPTKRKTKRKTIQRNSDDTYDKYGVNTKNSFNTPPKQ
jgi:hypothetical protein